MHGLLQDLPDLIAVNRSSRSSGYLYLVTEDASMGTSGVWDKDRYDQRFQFINA